jgi:hypothetical protein
MVSGGDAKPRIRLQKGITHEYETREKSKKSPFGPSDIGAITASQREAVLSHFRGATPRQHSGKIGKHPGKMQELKQKRPQLTWKDALKQKQFEGREEERKARNAKPVDTEKLIAQMHEIIKLAAEIHAFVPETPEDIAEIERRIAERKRKRDEAEHFESIRYEDTYGDPSEEIEGLEELAKRYGDIIIEKTAEARKKGAQVAQVGKNIEKIINKLEKSLTPNRKISEFGFQIEA